MPGPRERTGSAAHRLDASIYCRANQGQISLMRGCSAGEAEEQPVQSWGGAGDPKGFIPKGRIATNWFVAPLSARARQLTP
jgi:hypothetical protein